MKISLICVKAYYLLGHSDGHGIHTRFFNLPIIENAYFDMLETYMEDIERMGYEDICILAMDDELHIVDSIQY
jgi:hypothetical protein